MAPSRRPPGKANRSGKTPPPKKKCPRAAVARVVDIRALRGPDGTLDGDARALLIGVQCDDPATGRDVHMRTFLGDFERQEGEGQRCALAAALWPICKRLWEHHGEQGVATWARQELTTARRLRSPVAARRLSTLMAHLEAARPILDEIRAHYQDLDAVWEPLVLADVMVWEARAHRRVTADRPPGAVGGGGTPRLLSLLAQARDALLAHRPDAAARPALGRQRMRTLARRRPRRGNPVTGQFARDARKILTAYLDEDQQTQMLQLVGVLPLP